MDRTDVYQKYEVKRLDGKVIEGAKYFVLRVDRAGHWWDELSRWAIDRMARRLFSDADLEMRDFGKALLKWVANATGNEPEPQPVKIYWVPEAPKYPGLYAPKGYREGVNTMTFEFSKALKFETKAECKAWCDSHPTPNFNPVEHSEI